MPLSEHEQRLLDQIERALYQEDPKFATTVRSSDLRTHMRRRMRRAGIVLALGFVLLMAGVVSSQFFIGILGFVVMLGALLLAMTSWKRVSGPPQPNLRVVGGEPRVERAARAPRPGRAPKPARGPKPTGGFLKRIEDRWEKRWDERGREQ